MTLPAVGFAAALLETVDFAIKCLQKQNVVFQPSDPEAQPTPLVENPQLLQKTVDTLFRLTDATETSALKRLSTGTKAKLSEPAQQLLSINEVARVLVLPLIDALIAAQAKGSFGDPRWGTVREALCSSVWKERDVTGLKRKLRAVRKEVDVALLLALRQYLDQSAETGLPVFSEDLRIMSYWERWQNEALDAVHANEWDQRNKKHVEEFSKQVDRLVSAATEAHFCEQLFSRLSFEEMDHRLHSISAPLEGTMNWVFDDQQTDEGGVLEWLGNQRGENLFWITGKPGAGKTTLMRHLFRNDAIFDYLEAWSGHAPGITSGFFLWNCGTELQRSGLGLLRSLLYESLQDMIYGPLEQEMGIVQTIFPERWEQFRTYGGGTDALSFAELRRAFELMISDADKKFLFMIDGLDESDEAGEYVDVIPLIISASKRENVKILVSSRPSPAFQEAFEKRPKLWVDDHTTDDVHTFLLDSFSRDESLAKLRGNTVAPEETDVVATLSAASCGVFLWGILASRFLLQDLTSDDTFTSLQHRAEGLPSDIDELLSHMMSNLEPADLEEVWKLSVLIEANCYPSILALSFALSSDEASSIAARRQPLKTAEVAQRIDAMRQLLTCKCRNLFAVFDTQDPEQRTPSIDAPDSLKVTYTHRCVRIFFLSSAAQPTKPTTDFSPISAWAAAHLTTLKTLVPPSTSGTMRVWAPLARCLETSLALAAHDAKSHTSYIHAALDTALGFHTHGSSAAGSSSSAASTASSKRPTSAYPTAAVVVTTDLPAFPHVPLASPLDLAVLLNLQTYVAVAVRDVDRKVVRAAMEYSGAVRRRIGVGGEAVWLGGKEKGGGRGLERLRAEFARGRGEIEVLLEYYAQALRWGKKAPVFEVGEYV